MPRLRAITLLSLATSLVVPAAFAQNTITARPGTVNYVEGQADINGQALTSNSHNELGKGQTVSTENGKVEILLTPGVFLRVGQNSAVTMVSPDLTNTEVQLDRGTAEVEVDQLYKQNHLLVDQGPAQTELLKHGLYEFDANANQVRVFDGEAAVSPSQDAKKWIKVKSHHEFALNGDQQEPQKFDTKELASNDQLYNWSKLRSDYLGHANQQIAQEYAGNAFHPGWFWDPGLYAYTWLPGDGLFWSPFGYGFYSPGYFYGGGMVYPGFYEGGVVRGVHGVGGFHGGFHDRDDFHRAAPAGHAFNGGGFHANSGAFHSGGPAGGFHGGGFGGGGFHGGARR